MLQVFDFIISFLAVTIKSITLSGNFCFVHDIVRHDTFVVAIAAFPNHERQNLNLDGQCGAVAAFVAGVDR